MSIGDPARPDLCNDGRIEPVIRGTCLPELTAVHDAFRQNFIERGEVGAAVCIIRNGDVVVDLWGGWTDESRATEWSADTLVDFYSVGKALVATLVLQLVDERVLDLETRVGEVWPEFAAGGKHDVTVRQALCHEAAVPAIRERLTNSDLFDWSTMTDALAATDAWWPIGTRHAYHTNTYGFLLGELVRRCTGVLPGERLRRVATDIGADVWFGVPEDDQHRCADVIWAPPHPIDANDIDVDQFEGDQLMNVLAHFNPPGASSLGVVNTREWRSAQVPSTNGHGTARGLATFYAALLEPGRVLSPSLLQQATRAQNDWPLPDPRRGHRIRAGFHSDQRAPAARSQPEQLRALRDRWRIGLRRSRRRHRLWVRHEPCDPALAEHPEPSSHREPLRNWLRGGAFDVVT